MDDKIVSIVNTFSNPCVISPLLSPPAVGRTPAAPPSAVGTSKRPSSASGTSGFCSPTHDEEEPANKKLKTSPATHPADERTVPDVVRLVKERIEESKASVTKNTSATSTLSKYIDSNKPATKEKAVENVKGISHEVMESQYNIVEKNDRDLFDFANEIIHEALMAKSARINSISPFCVYHFQSDSMKKCRTVTVLCKRIAGFYVTDITVGTLEGETLRYTLERHYPVVNVSEQDGKPVLDFCTGLKFSARKEESSLFIDGVVFANVPVGFILPELYVKESVVTVNTVLFEQPGPTHSVRILERGDRPLERCLSHFLAAGEGQTPFIPRCSRIGCRRNDSGFNDLCCFSNSIGIRSDGGASITVTVEPGVRVISALVESCGYTPTEIEKVKNHHREYTGVEFTDSKTRGAVLDVLRDLNECSEKWEGVDEAESQREARARFNTNITKCEPLVINANHSVNEHVDRQRELEYPLYSSTLGLTTEAMDMQELTEVVRDVVKSVVLNLKSKVKGKKDIPNSVASILANYEKRRAAILSQLVVPENTHSYWSKQSISVASHLLLDEYLSSVIGKSISDALVKKVRIEGTGKIPKNHSELYEYGRREVDLNYGGSVSIPMCSKPGRALHSSVQKWVECFLPPFKLQSNHMSTRDEKTHWTDLETNKQVEGTGEGPINIDPKPLITCPSSALSQFTNRLTDDICRALLNSGGNRAIVFDNMSKVLNLLMEHVKPEDIIEQHNIDRISKPFNRDTLKLYNMDSSNDMLALFSDKYSFFTLPNNEKELQKVIQDVTKGKHVWSFARGLDLNIKRIKQAVREDKNSADVMRTFQTMNLLLTVTLNHIFQQNDAHKRLCKTLCFHRLRTSFCGMQSSPTSLGELYNYYIAVVARNAICDIFQFVRAEKLPTFVSEDHALEFPVIEDRPPSESLKQFLEHLECDDSLISMVSNQIASCLNLLFIRVPDNLLLNPRESEMFKFEKDLIKNLKQQEESKNRPELSPFYESDSSQDGRETTSTENRDRSESQMKVGNITVTTSFSPFVTPSTPGCQDASNGDHYESPVLRIDSAGTDGNENRKLPDVHPSASAKETEQDGLESSNRVVIGMQNKHVFSLNWGGMFSNVTQESVQVPKTITGPLYHKCDFSQVGITNTEKAVVYINSVSGDSLLTVVPDRNKQRGKSDLDLIYEWYLKRGGPWSTRPSSMSDLSKSITLPSHLYTASVLRGKTQDCTFFSTLNPRRDKYCCDNLCISTRDRSRRVPYCLDRMGKSVNNWHCSINLDKNATKSMFVSNTSKVYFEAVHDPRSKTKLVPSLVDCLQSQLPVSSQNPITNIERCSKNVFNFNKNLPIASTIQANPLSEFELKATRLQDPEDSDAPRVSAKIKYSDNNMYATPSPCCGGTYNTVFFEYNSKATATHYPQQKTEHVSTTEVNSSSNDDSTSLKKYLELIFKTYRDNVKYRNWLKKKMVAAARNNR